MKRQKKPTIAKREAAYPSLRQSKVDRRRFLTLLGGGVAGSTFLAACYETDEGGSDIDSVTGASTDSTTDTGTGSVSDTDTGSGTGTGSDSETVDTDTGWDTNDIAGGESAPEYFDRRLPETGFQVVHLGEGAEVVYAVATVFEEPLFGQMSEEVLLGIIDKKLQTSHPNIFDYETEDGLDLVEAAVKEALTEACLSEKGARPFFIEVTFIVERLRRNDPIDGDVAPPSFPDTDSGMR